MKREKKRTKKNGCGSKSTHALRLFFKTWMRFLKENEYFYFKELNILKMPKQWRKSYSWVKQHTHSSSWHVYSNIPKMTSIEKSRQKEMPDENAILLSNVLRFKCYPTTSNRSPQCYHAEQMLWRFVSTHESERVQTQRLGIKWMCIKCKYMPLAIMHTHLYTLNEDYYFIFIQPNKTNEEKIGCFSLHSRTYFFVSLFTLYSHSIGPFFIVTSICSE